MNMKDKATLYNRLKPNYLSKLVEQREKLPNMVAAAERAMNDNVWVISLTVGEMCTICDVLEIDWNNIFLIFEYE